MSDADLDMTTPVHLGYNRVQLEAAFNRVKNLLDWKKPISRTLVLENPEEEFKVIDAAVGFYTGSQASLTHVRDNIYQVRADGYYLAVGA